MSDFSATWELVRSRFVASVTGLSEAQLNFRVYPGTLTIGEMILHVAGVEFSFASQLLGESVEGDDMRLKAAATDGTVNDRPFPYEVHEITPEFTLAVLERTREKLAPMMADPEPYRGREIVSALGPVIDGTGAFARLAYHPSYHHGQVHFVVSSPDFPAA